MKILVHGTPKVRAANWWHGRPVHCTVCEAVFQLEPGDHVASLSTPERHAEVTCPTEGCSTVMWIYPKDGQ